MFKVKAESKKFFKKLLITPYAIIFGQITCFPRKAWVLFILLSRYFHDWVLFT